MIGEPRNDNSIEFSKVSIEAKYTIISIICIWNKMIKKNVNVALQLLTIINDYSVIWTTAFQIQV